MLQATSVDEALRIIKEERADVVLADVGLPGKDGYAFVHELRALETDDSHMAVAAVTAYARPEDRESLLAAGFDAHVPKPVEPAVPHRNSPTIVAHALTSRRSRVVCLHCLSSAPFAERGGTHRSTQCSRGELAIAIGHFRVRARQLTP